MKIFKVNSIVFGPWDVDQGNTYGLDYDGSGFVLAKFKIIIFLSDVLFKF